MRNFHYYLFIFFGFAFSLFFVNYSLNSKPQVLGTTSNNGPEKIGAGNLPTYEPFFYSNSTPGYMHMSGSTAEKDWCVQSEFFCEDSSGKYFNTCTGLNFRGYSCSNDKQPHCEKDLADYCHHVTMTMAEAMKSHSVGTTDPGEKCTLAGCFNPDKFPSLFKPVDLRKDIYNSDTTDGTWCEVLNNNTICKDNSGTYTNYCSGNTSVRYFCTNTFDPAAKIAFKNIKCVSADFPCSKTCSGTGTCGQIVYASYVPTPAPTSAPTSALIPTSAPTLTPTSVPTIFPTTTSVPTPTLKPTPEPIPTTFNPTPHRVNVSFWQSFLNWFKLNKQ